MACIWLLRPWKSSLISNYCIFFFNGLLMLSLDLLNGSLMVFLHFVCKLLSNLWEHHITTMLSEVFYLRLLTSKKQFVHTLLIVVTVNFCWVLGSIHEVPHRGELVQLLLMPVIFSATKGLYNISGLFVIFKYLTHFSGTRPKFFIDGHNTQFYCIKDKWHDRRHFIFSSFRQKIFVSSHQTHNHDFEHLPRRYCRHSPANNTCRFLYVFSSQSSARAQMALYIALFNQSGSNTI